MAPRLTARDHLLRAVTEAAFQKQVEDMLTLYGWRYFHAPNNRPGKNGRVQNVKAGFPDLNAVRGKRILYAELKTETGRTTPDQDAWAADLRATGLVEVYVWRPRDLEEIARVLAPGWTT